MAAIFVTFCKLVRFFAEIYLTLLHNVLPSLSKLILPASTKTESKLTKFTLQSLSNNMLLPMIFLNMIFPKWRSEVSCASSDPKIMAENLLLVVTLGLSSSLSLTPKQ